MNILFRIFWLILINLSFYFVNWFLNAPGSLRIYFFFFSLPLSSHSLSIAKLLHSNVNNCRIQGMDELHHRHPLIRLNNMDNGYIQIHHRLYHKMDTAA